MCLSAHKNTDVNKIEKFFICSVIHLYPLSQLRSSTGAPSEIPSDLGLTRRVRKYKNAFLLIPSTASGPPPLTIRGGVVFDDGGDKD